MSNNLSDYWKVPYREVYCDTFAEWVRSIWRCHVWKWHPNRPGTRCFYY